ncbi:MAG: hypothetical protein A2Y53_06035 [Chloroflexi bacterium RBG_16_47_49]|nr:MAG: hypothetical protein A2Y53_06035 [Chloroflexi bacterium RBG_16_47_49]
MDSNHSLRVCYFGTYRENYSRNQMMIAGLRLNGIIVKECHETLWHGIGDRVRTVRGGWINPLFWVRIVSLYWRLLIRYMKQGEYDVLIVGYPGQLDVFLARALTWLKHKPMVWDVFMSIYLVALERRLDKGNQFSITLLHLLEGWALKLPNMLILDTSEYVNWFTQNYKISSERFRLVPTGADDRIFTPLPDKDNKGDKFRVLYAGTFIPNHGVMYILEAARMLINEPQIIFEFIGNGPELKSAQQFVEQNQLKNVRFVDWVEKDELIKYISQADVCLGAFGTTPQSLMTVQNKIYESMAMRKALINGDSPAVRQVFTHGEHIYLCDRANGKSLAAAIIILWRNPTLREHLAQNGYRLFRERYNLQNNGKLCATHIRELIS